MLRPQPKEGKLTMTDENWRAQQDHEDKVQRTEKVREKESVIKGAIECAQYQVNRARRNARKDEDKINAERENKFDCVIHDIAVAARNSAKEAKDAADKVAQAADAARASKTADEHDAHDAEAAKAVVEAEAALARAVSARTNLAKFVEEFDFVEEFGNE